MELTALYDLYQKHPQISTDTRKIDKGCLFFALKGANFDGNAFAQQAIDKGAAYAIVDDKEKVTGKQFLLVEDVLSCLQRLANFHRKQFDIPVIAITGSNGKTTTKELIGATLKSHYPTHCTEGNFNNHIGVPLTLLAMPPKTEVAIIEMGANHIGEIAFLCRIAEPTHGIITNIGAAHLEGFGGIEGVKIGKGELYRFLENNKGTAFVNLNEDYLKEMAGDRLYRIEYAESNAPQKQNSIFQTKLLSINPFVEVAALSEFGELTNISSQLFGAYNFNNIQTAITIGKYFKVPFAKIKKAIEAYNPQNNRSQVVKMGSNQFLLDAYNANPSSVSKALEGFANHKVGRKMAILGDMLELGTYSEQAHREIVKHAFDLDIPLVTVGSEFGKVRKKEKLHFANTQKLADWFWEQKFEDTFFLLKASRGIRLEGLLSSQSS